MPSIQKFILPLLLLGVIILGWEFQAALFLNYDVSWLMHAARRWLQGGTYSRDFFETNPPLILYLYLPPVLLTKLTGFHPALVFRGFLFALAFFSLGICASLLKKIITPEEGRLFLAFYLMLALVIFILPCFDFGQREHLAIILTLPYFFMLTRRLQKQEINSVFAFALGILAGIGFSIKPHFLLTPLLLEIYYSYSHKGVRASLRPEVFALLLFVFFYALSIFLFFPDYLYVVLPYSLRLYYPAVSQPWLSLLFNSAAVFCLIALLFYLLQRKGKQESSLSTVLALGLLGFLIAYFAQRMTHYYHLIPALSLALLLLVVEFAFFLRSLPSRARHPELLRYAQNDSLRERFFAVMLGLLFVSIPLWIFCTLFMSSLDYKKETMGRLMTFLNQNAKNEAVVFFVTAGSFAFPTLDYTTSRVSPRFYFLWMAAGLSNLTFEKDSRMLDEQEERDKNFLINMISDDLYQYKPRYVFVDLSERKYRIRDKNFDYLLYFSENPKFRQEWRHYQYETTLEEKGRFKLGVYRRQFFLDA